MTDSSIQLRPSALLRALTTCHKARRPAFVWGSPGIGKSDVVRQLAKNLNARLIDVRASQWDAVDTRGVPYIEHHFDRSMPVPTTGPAQAATTRWAVPSVFPSDDVPTILFLDELNSAAPSVQAALYQLILDRRVGDYALPDSVYVMGAGNLETDRAVTHRMSTALAGRFVHFEMVVDNADWESWALANDVHTAVIAYMRWRPAHLHAWDARSTSKAQATPRTWEFASQLLAASDWSRDADLALMAGTIGNAIGTEFAGFLRVYRELPDPDAVLMSPDVAPIPQDPATCYALCGALAARASERNADAVLKYAGRMGEDSGSGPEFMTLLVRMAAVRQPRIQSTRAFIQWAANNPDVLL